MSWRNELTVGIMRAERIFYGTSNGGLGSELSTTELGWLDDITPGTGEASKCVVLDANADITGGIRDFKADRFMYVGDDDVTYGRIYVYGGAVDQGGFIRLYTAANSDTNDEFCSINCTSEQMWLGFENDLDMFILHGPSALNKVELNVDLDLNANLIMGSTTVTESEIAALDGLTPGTATASKLVQLDANKDFSGIRNLYLGVDGSEAGSFRIYHSDAGPLQEFEIASDDANNTWEIRVGSQAYIVLDDDTGPESVKIPGMPDGLHIGVDNSYAGMLKVFGNSTTSPGEIRIYSPGNYDSYDDYYRFYSGSNQLRIAGATDGVILAYNSSSNEIEFNKAFYTDQAFNVSGTFQLFGVTVSANANELNYNDLSAAIGTATASKTVVLDANKDFSGIRALELGVQGSQYGSLNLRGGASDQGGELRWYAENSGSYDEYFRSYHDGNYMYLLRGSAAGMIAGYSCGSAQFEVSKNMYIDANADCTGTLSGYDIVANNELRVTSDLILGGVTVSATATQLNYNDIATLGTMEASKVLTASAGNVATLGGTVNLSGTWQVGGVAVSATAAELNYLDIAVLGTGVASKAVVLDGSGNYTAPAGTWNLSGATAVNTPTGGLQIGGVAITSTAAELNVLDGVSATLAATDLNITELTTLGTHEASKALTLSAGGHMTGIAGDWGLTSVTSIDIAVGALELAGVAVTADAAELNVLDGATAGTQVANKAVVADANINTGVSKVTQLHIGASGAETQVTATAAELNYNDITTLGTMEASKVLTADGSNIATLGGTVNLSGTFQIGGSQVNASAAELNTKEFTVLLTDLSTGGTAYIACPVAGTVTRVDSVVTGDPGGDSTTTLNVNGGASMAGTLVIANGAAAGERDTASPSTNNTVAAGDAIHLVFDSTPTNAVNAYVTVTVTL